MTFSLTKKDGSDDPMRIRTIITLTAMTFFSMAPHANASSAGQPCPALNAVERDGGQTLICDGTIWRHTTTIQPSGAVLLTGKTDNLDETLFFNSTNENGTPTGDGFRLRRAQIPPASNVDYYIFEKTDGNNPDTDGGLLFVRTAMDGIEKPWLLMHGPTGNIGIKSNVAHSALYVPSGEYAQFAQVTAGPPTASHCNSDTLRGRISIDTTNNRLYICNGAARGWDYIALTD